MNSILTRSGVAALLLLLGGCAKKPVADVVETKRASVDLVPEAERSKHFAAVTSNLELGGTLYAYADVDGDALELADGVQAMVQQIAAAQPQVAQFARQDFKALFNELGLNDVKAFGISSVLQAGGIYRNRTFIYTPDGRHGLLAVFGGQPGRFVGQRLAPPDADFYSECEFDVSALYDTVKAVVARVSGPDAAASMEKKLKDAGAQSGYSMLDVIEGLKGRMIIIIRMEPTNTFTIAGPPKTSIPAFSLFVSVDGIGQAVLGALEKDAKLSSSVSGSRHLFAHSSPFPVVGLQPVLAIEGKSFYVASSAAFLDECLNRTAGLETNPQFAAGLAALGPEGNGLSWVSQRFFSRLGEISTMNPGAPPPMKRAFDMFARNLPAVSQPLLSVRSNLPDGILVRSDWNKSLKTDVAMFTIYNPVTVGLMAAMAIPAFQKVRANAQHKAAMNNSRRALPPQAPLNSQTEAITDNLRVLDEAADRYYAEHDTTTTTLDQLVGPDKYIPAIRSVAGEDYRTVLFKKGRPLRLFLSDGRMIMYPPPQ